MLVRKSSFASCLLVAPMSSLKTSFVASQTISRKMFEGSFKEGLSQSATLDEEEGAVSIQGFELLIQWLYIGRVIFKETSEEKKISSIIEFARTADICLVTGMERSMADEIRGIINDAENVSSTSDGMRDLDLNTRLITSKHIKYATSLPHLHPVRQLLAEAAVEGYFRRKDTHKFHSETIQVPEFAVDLLEAARVVLQQMSYHDLSQFTDPITDKKLSFHYTPLLNCIFDER